MNRTEVRHEAFEVLMDSRSTPEWLGPVVAEEKADIPPAGDTSDRR